MPSNRLPDLYGTTSQEVSYENSVSVSFHQHPSSRPAHGNFTDLENVRKREYKSQSFYLC
jgi:hypothetical protein